MVVTVVEYRVGGSAMREQRLQMTRRERMTTALVVLALRGLMTALLLSRVMASIVKTLADTVDRDMNWFKQQYTAPKFQTLQSNAFYICE